MSFSIYYENKLKNISIEYNKSRESFQEATGKTVLENVNETIQLKETFQKDKEALEKSYYDLKTENEGLIRDYDKLKAQIDSVKSELERSKSNFDKLQNQFKQVRDSLASADQEISRLAGKVNELCSRLKTYNADEKC